MAYPRTCMLLSLVASLGAELSLAANVLAHPPAKPAFVHPPVMSQALPLASYSSGLTLCQVQPPKDVTGYFQVTSAQAARIDQMVFMELRGKMYRGKIKGAPVRYARQFLGLHRGDRSVIYVNAVFPPPQDSFEQLAHDCTGRYAYWGIEYDLSFERFSNFSINKRHAKK